MRHIKLVAVVLGTLLAPAVVAASAFALPDISVTLSGGTYPIKLNGELAAATSTGASSGVAAEGKGVTLLLLITELSALGTFEAIFTQVKSPNADRFCNNAGQTKETGNVLVAGEFHVVLIPPSPAVGVLFLVTFLEIECGTLAPEVKGDIVGSSEGAGSEGTELTALGGELRGESGKQVLSEYFNAAGTIVRAKLELEAGSGFISADENVEGEVRLSVLGSQMIVITGR